MRLPIAPRLTWQVLSAVCVCLITGLIADGQTTTEKPLVLISEANSTRAIAFESVTFRKEPFALSTPFASDGRTRVMVFALNLALAPDEDVSAIAVDAETVSHTHYSLRVEDGA